MLLQPVVAEGGAVCCGQRSTRQGRVCVLPTTHQLCPLWSSLCFSDSRSHQGRWRPSLASARGASAAVLVSAVLVLAVVLVKLELYAGTVGESTTASGAAAALDAATKNHSMQPHSRRKMLF